MQFITQVSKFDMAFIKKHVFLLLLNILISIVLKFFRVSPSNTSKNIISNESDKSSSVNPDDGGLKSIDNATHSSTQTTLVS